ncbi:MAG TPA: phosphodiester glycosidase family protein [Verrucomicrobiae bacterium]|nr:phosphodiester glycosidase family protein [Verrucomicrobiae bacterium]
MKSLVSVAIVFLGVVTARGASSVSAWVPIFQGIDQAKGTNDASYFGTLSANALRVDLQNPDIRLMVTPPVTNNYIPDQRETFLQTPREFVTEFGLQAGVNSGYFSPGGYFNPSGTPAWIQGLTISKGRLVSAQTSSNDCLSTILFTTNNQATYVPIDWPATNIAGIYNAISGLYPLVSSGENIGYRYTNALSETIHQPQPRTAFGLSQDNRYLILMTIDGRQNFSDGALDYETAELLLLFGAWNGMNVDGGGSTCMVKANECGVPVDINQNSFQLAVGRPGSQRPIGCNFGVSALPLPSPMKDVAVLPGTTTAIITWQTEVESTTQVQYGLTTGYGDATPFDDAPRKFHVATLYGLIAGSTYYYRAVSMASPEEYSLACTFSTTNAISHQLVIPMTGSWKYSTNNLDSVSWKGLAYDDTGWMGPNNAVLHIDNSIGAFPPRNTLLPPGFVTPIFRTYYFRTPFSFSGTTSNLSLTFSNYIDDGAVFYLNGTELNRVRMPSGALNNATFASAPVSCGAVNDAVCPDVFTISGNLLTNLVQGSNLIAVELHNYQSGSDILFGSALTFNRPGLTIPKLFIASEAGQSTLYWNGEGFTLQQSTDLSSTNNWFDVIGPVMQSPFTTTTNVDAAFFQLRN